MQAAPVSRQPAERLATLDGMRGIAALAVALYHWGLATQPLAEPGYLAFDFFFALSGFVIALNYADRLSGGMTPLQFITLRIIRFFPIYLAGHGLGLAQNVALQISGSPNARSGTELLLAVVLGLFMLPVPLDVRNLFPLNPPAWTLFLELLVNILFAFGMFRWSARILAAIMLASAATLIMFTGPPLFYDVGYSASTFLLGLARLGYSFPLGILMFRMLGDRNRRQSALAFIPLGVMAVCLLVAPPDAIRGVWEALCVFVLFPILLAAGIRMELPRAASPVFAFLGDVSFAVYATHGPLILFVNKLTTILGLGRWPSLAFFLGVVLLVAYLVSRFYDMPVRGALARWRKRVAT